MLYNFCGNERLLFESGEHIERQLTKMFLLYALFFIAACNAQAAVENATDHETMVSQEPDHHQRRLWPMKLVKHECGIYHNMTGNTQCNEEQRNNLTIASDLLISVSSD